MSEPSREHIDAVARAIFDVRDDEFDLDEWEDADSLHRERYQCDARAILTSTDPAVLDAMQDALVRAGRLTEERAIDKPGRRGINPQRRYVTEWEDQ